ncbi:ladderlectin-like isoform X5 [Labrus mixtus]|uniref:ladderlectin-like isoform X5 n=1 Tax=Labrus mixtus TaxID=508554 RepID=UPI0029C04172|nr:ladderlectin-like isoform X5 [Labrus mixtus]
MKLLTGLLLVCATMALTNAAAVPEAQPDVMAVGASMEDDDGHTVQRSSACPSGWIQHYNRCFLFVRTSMTWTNAEINCQARGGRLASVHSFDEYHFIQGIILRQTGMYPSTWLGGSDAQQEGTWLWSDGSRFSYVNWYPGQPDNQHHYQHCLVMNFADQKRWDDLQCYHQHPFVCSKTLESCLG